MRRQLEELKFEFEPLTKSMKKILDVKVEKIIMRYRIVDSPCVITKSVYDWTDEVDEGDTQRQSWEGNYELQNRRFAVCYHDVSVRLVCQHGANHVNAGAERHLDDFLHGVQEND